MYCVRKLWEVRSYMLDIADNYPSHRKYEKYDWLCQACDLKVREDQDHLTKCPGYSDLLWTVDVWDISYICYVLFTL